LKGKKEKLVILGDELNHHLEELRTRPDCCAKEEVEQAAKIIEALRK